MIDELLDTIVEEVATAPDFQGAAEKLTDWAQRLTGAEAAMLRYREGESEGEAWIPALVERGFGGSFLRDEVLVGEKECLCGRICRGRLDQSFPFVTPGGSFLWGKVQETAAEYPQDLPGGIRGRCISGAFDSVLIVPLVAEGTPIGCLHLADSAPGKFSDCVETIELACRVCAPGLLRFSSADRRESVIKAAETVLMPPELGQVRGFDLAVSYSSATKTA
jgi:GAF domain-containing protein